MSDVQKIHDLETRFHALGDEVDACLDQSRKLLDDAQRLQYQRREIRRQINELIGVSAND